MKNFTQPIFTLTPTLSQKEGEIFYDLKLVSQNDLTKTVWHLTILANCNNILILNNNYNL